MRRWADAGRLPMERDGSGNRMIDCVGLALFAGRAGGRRRAGRRARAAVLRAQRLHRRRHGTDRRVTPLISRASRAGSAHSRGSPRDSSRRKCSTRMRYGSLCDRRMAGPARGISHSPGGCGAGRRKCQGKARMRLLDDPP
ncbi:hypothetical protein [Streptomyces murinus]|uniref:hypothetical protein n=1 Tax=Streptomyces murinus TaxID=33900 RepID=UPI003F47237B